MSKQEYLFGYNRVTRAHRPVYQDSHKGDFPRSRVEGIPLLS